MRGLLTLVAVAGLMVAFLYWRLSGDPGGVQAAGPDPADPNRGRVVVGLEAQAATGPTASAPAPAAEAPAADGVEQAETSPAASEPAGQPVQAERTPHADSGAGTPRLPGTTATPLRYAVQPGDTLYSIVRRAYGAARTDLVEAVAAANRLEDSSSLEIGQVLVLPVVEGYPAPEPPEAGTSGR